tara:strand:+ start:441 stop:680 length:240 start_codon:yes stop_codon:yes gene_type:complete
MVEVRFDKKFTVIFSKLDESMKMKVKKQIGKILRNPVVGKPMKNVKKGSRELYISPFRLAYRIEDEIVYILDLYHKDEQ